MTLAATKIRLPNEPQVYLSIAFALTIVAFWPSYFSKLGSTDIAHSVHGVTATLWMAVPVLQSWLIRRGHFTFHRRVGWVALLVLAPVLVISGLHMVQLMVVRYDSIRAIRLLKFTFLDLSALTLFVLFLGLAVRSIQRKDVDAHSRYMTGTVLFALEPALERLFVFFVPGVTGFAEALYDALFSMEAILCVLLFLEWRRRRIRPPFLIALGFFAGMHALMTPVAASASFGRFAHWFATI